MREDNLYPRDGAVFSPFNEPDDQVSEREEMQNQTIKEYKHIEQSIERLGESIKRLVDVSMIAKELITKPDELAIRVAGNLEAAEILRAEKEWLEQLIKDIE